MQAFNFYSFDFYEPIYFCLKPVKKYLKYEFQLRIMFQLVKSTSLFSLPKTVDLLSNYPIAYQIVIDSAEIDVSVFAWSNL